MAGWGQSDSEGQPGYEPTQTYQAQPRNAAQPDFPGQPGYAPQPGYNGQPGFPGQPGYFGQPVPPGYPVAPGYPGPYPFYQGPGDPMGFGRPSVAPTFLVTLFFGIFGLIPAIRHSQMARERGYPQKSYWWTFGLTIGIQVLLWVAFYVTVFAIVAHTANGTYGVSG